MNETTPYISPYVAWYGRDEAPPQVTKLRAGPLNLDFHAGELRYIGHGGAEYFRRLHVAVRDHNWSTIPSHIRNLVIDAQADHFQIRFDAFAETETMQFRWQGTIKGGTDGRITYEMQGVAESDFRYCRIGFCLLHPIAGIAGQPYRAQTPAGEIHGELPKLIAPQTMDENGFEKPIFPSCSSLTLIAEDGTQVQALFEGDLFEIEDQRNWTDGSYKTYCTPLSLGYPHNATRGQKIEQRVTVWAEIPRGLLKASQEADDQPLAMRVQRSERSLPKLGFGLTTSGQPRSAREIALLRDLRPDHLKIEVHLAQENWRQRLSAAISLANGLESALEVMLFLNSDSDELLKEVGALLQGVNVARVIVVHEAEAADNATAPKWMQLARQTLAAALPNTKLMGGTNGNFAQLNREPPDMSLMDGITYTLNPQVHASDERSMVEGIQAQRDTVVTARSFSGDLPICISSVTLKPPFNQAATEAVSQEASDQVPTSVDPRQMSLFAAGWTVGSVRSLAAGGADAVTYYETSGWRGLMECEAGSPLPEKFPSSPGMVFPLYYVFAFLAAGKGAKLIEITSPTSIFVEGVGYEQNGLLSLAIANLQPHTQAITLDSLPAGEAMLQRLNAESMELAAAHPEEFLAQSQPFSIQASGVTLHLKPYETVFLRTTSR